MSEGKNSRHELDNFVNALIDDLLATPDGDFLREEIEDGRDPKILAQEIRTLVQKGKVIAAKSKLREAKTAVATSQTSRVANEKSIDPAHARQLLKKLVANDPEFNVKFTFAARNEEELSDADILSIIEDLRELGELTDKGNES